MPRLCIVCGSNSCRFKKTVFQARYTTWGGLGRGGTRMLYCSVPLCRDHESHFDDYNRRGFIFVGLLFGVIALGALGAILIHPLAIAGALLMAFLLLGGYLVLDMTAKQTLVHATSITQHEVTLANVHRKFARAGDEEHDQEADRDRRSDRRRGHDRDEDDEYGGSREDESWNFGKRSPQTTWIVLAVVAGIFLFLFCGISAVVFTMIGVLGRTVQVQPHRPGPGPGDPAVPNPPVAFPDQAFLDDFRETDSRVGWGQLGKKGLLGFEFKGTPAEKNRLLFEGKPYDHALSMHPPTNGIASAKYRLDGHYRTLTGTAAMADLPPASGLKESPSPITFRIWADGRVLWTSPPLKQRGAKADFRVDLAKARELELQAVCNGQGHYTWAVWLNPHVSK